MVQPAATASASRSGKQASLAKADFNSVSDLVNHVNNGVNSGIDSAVNSAYDYVNNGAVRSSSLYNLSRAHSPYPDQLYIVLLDWAHEAVNPCEMNSTPQQLHKLEESGQ